MGMMSKVTLSKKTRRQRGKTLLSGAQKLGGVPCRNRPASLGIRRYSKARVRRVLREFGQRIKTLRNKKGLTPEGLAKNCGIKLVKVLKMENGEVNASLSTAVRLAGRLKIRFDHLFKGIA